MRQGVITWSRPICDALVMFAVQCFTVAGILPRTQHCNNGRPTPVCYPYRPRLKYSVTRSSSMKSPRLNFHAKRARTSSSCCLSLFQEASYTQTTSAEVPVLHTPVEVSRGEMTSIPRTARYVVRNQAETAEDAESTGEHHRIQQHAIIRFFPHFVVFDGFI